MSFTALTPASLFNALKALSSARSERECTAALVAGASMLQQAVFNNQDPADLQGWLADVPADMGAYMAEIFGRAVDFHNCDDGILGLWLLPVAITTEATFRAPLSLGAGMTAMRTGAVLLEQLGLTSTQLGCAKSGWVLPVPALYTADQLTQADFAELVRLPVAARQVVRGELKQFKFAVGQDECPAGGNMLYMPFVAYSPAGQNGVFELNAKVEASAIKWIRSSLAANGIPGSAHLAIPDFPRPYSEMVNEAPALSFRIALRNYLYMAIKGSGCQPQALVAHLSPYATPQTGSDLVIGINLRSRLSRQIVGNITMPTYSESGLEEIGDAVVIMRTMGFARVMVNHAPIQSLICQDCGSLQMQAPPDALIDASTIDTPPHLH